MRFLKLWDGVAPRRMRSSRLTGSLRPGN